MPSKVPLEERTKGPYVSSERAIWLRIAHFWGNTTGKNFLCAAPACIREFRCCRLCTFREDCSMLKIVDTIADWEMGSERCHFLPTAKVFGELCVSSKVNKYVVVRDVLKYSFSYSDKNKLPTRCPSYFSSCKTGRAWFLPRNESSHVKRCLRARWCSTPEISSSIDIRHIITS